MLIFIQICHKKTHLEIYSYRGRFVALSSSFLNFCEKFTCRRIRFLKTSINKYVGSFHSVEKNRGKDNGKRLILLILDKKSVIHLFYSFPNHSLF